MCRTERRKHERLPLQLNMLCQRVGINGNEVSAGKTVNISTGGVYFHLSDCELCRDDLLNLELTVPPTEGLLELGGRVSMFARVLRVHPPEEISDSPTHHAVAARFLEYPKFVG